MESDKKPEGENKTKKMCCACPETKKQRDQCVLLLGEEQCKEAIQKHIECLRKEGFNV
jgi:cytochrome c oxidase assembly protein subunit 17